MPKKYPDKKGWKVPKQKYHVTNWSAYNNALRRRGSIDLWMTEDAINQWYEKDIVNIGTGAPTKFSDLAIIVCHEIRLLYKLPLRQCEGFINSIFTLKRIDIRCPSFSCLSKRLAELKIKSPRYKATDKPDDNVAAIAIDSTGLKRLGRDEWHQEKIHFESCWPKIPQHRHDRKPQIGIHLD